MLNKVMLLVCAGLCFGGPIDSLKPGEWYEVPNSHLRSVAVSYPTNIGSVANVMGAWSGGAYDTKRDRLLIWGGGHNDYGGNEIYAFDMNTLQWSVIWGPSPNIPAPNTTSTCGTYSDGNPTARHTYDGLEYLPKQDQFWITSGSGYCSGGGAPNDTWVFDLTQLTWTKKANNPIAYQELVTRVDTVTGHLWCVGNGSSLVLSEYDPVADTWTKVGNASIANNASGAVDQKYRKLVSLASGGNGYVFDLTTHARQTLTASGGSSLDRYPGLEYDPVSEKLVAWSGGTDVYTLNLASQSWTRVTPAGTNTVTPTGHSATGTFGRWRYVPSKNVFVGVNSIDENVFVYKLAAGAGTRGEALSPTVKRTGLDVYPNPVRGRALVRRDGGLPLRRAAIYDARGRHAGDAAGGVWNASGLSAGLYFIRAEVDGRQLQKPVVVLN